MAMGALTVLVVEDDDLNMKIMEAVFHGTGHCVITAEDGETGLQKAREHQPDLILMDIGLPDMNGLDAARILKANPKLKKIPVIAVTGYAMAEDEHNAIEAGCAGFISKPIDIKNFLETITAILDSKA